MFRHQDQRGGQNGNEAIAVKFIAIGNEVDGRLDDIVDHLKILHFVHHFLEP